MPRRNGGREAVDQPMLDALFEERRLAVRGSLLASGASPAAAAAVDAAWADLRGELLERLDRQRARDRHSERSFRTLIELAPDALFVHRDNVLLYVNPAGCAALDHPDPTALVGAPALSIIAPDDRGAVLARVAQLEDGRPTEPRELHFLRRDGSFVVMEVRSLPVIFDGAQAVLAMARDVSVRRQVQAERIQADRVQSMGTFAAGVAHEINNPLTYVATNVSFAVREVREILHADPGAPAAGRLRELAEALSDAQDGLDRVRHIVQEMRTFAVTGPHTRDRVDVSRVLRTSTNIAGGEIRRRARLVVDLREVPPVLASESRLGQVFLNLLVNAAHAIPDGDPASHEVRVVSAVGEDGAVVVEVRDTGSGIPEELRGRIFEPFFTTKPAGVGTGLGLSICQAIVTDLGGTIAVETLVGLGTVFRVTLPAAPARTPGFLAEIA